MCARKEAKESEKKSARERARANLFFFCVCSAMHTAGVIAPVQALANNNDEAAQNLQVKLAAVNAIPRENLEAFLLVDFIHGLLQANNPNVLNNQMVASLFKRICNDDQSCGAEDRIINLFSKGTLGSYCLDFDLLDTLSNKGVKD